MLCPVCSNSKKPKNNICPKCGYAYPNVGFFSKLLKKSDNNRPKHEFIINVISFLKSYYELINSNSYIAKRDYSSLLIDNKHVYDKISSLDKSKQLTRFCDDYNFNIENMLKCLYIFENFEKEIDKYNDNFVEKELKDKQDYLDRILHDYDKNITLDDEQRRVVICDEDYSLVIAGAGSGKTTTVAAKVKYLVDIKKIDLKEILVI